MNRDKYVPDPVKGFRLKNCRPTASCTLLIGGPTNLAAGIAFAPANHSLPRGISTNERLPRATSTALQLISSTGSMADFPTPLKQLAYEAPLPALPVSTGASLRR